MDALWPRILGEEDIVDDVLGLEAVATDGSVVGTQVAGLPKIRI
jgi:hypothetical protein